MMQERAPLVAPVQNTVYMLERLTVFLCSNVLPYRIFMLERRTVCLCSNGLLLCSNYRIFMLERLRVRAYRIVMLDIFMLEV